MRQLNRSQGVRPASGADKRRLQASAARGASKRELDEAAQLIAAAVAEAFSAQPGGLVLEGVSVWPLKVLASDGSSGQMYQVPVIPGEDAIVRFGTPQPGVAAARGDGGVVARDLQRIGDAVARGAIPRRRAAFWAARSAAGQDIGVLDQLAGGLTVAAGAAPQQRDPDDYGRLFGAPQVRPAEDDPPEYRAMFGAGDGTSAEQVRAADRAVVVAMSDDQCFETLFGAQVVRKPPVPVTASARRAGGKPEQYRVRHPLVSLRVPDPAASAGDGAPRWKSVDLHAGDRVPADAHPDDVSRLLHKLNQHGAALKPF